MSRTADNQRLNSQDGHRSLKPFLTIWAGQTVSLLGSGMTGFALSVWVFSQTGNATPIALTALSQWLPRIMLAPLAGIVADRFRRKHVMILSDSLAAIATAAGAALVFTGNLEIWHIYTIAAVLGTAGAFQSPAMTASVTMLVDKDNLSRAAGMQQVSQAVEAIATPVIAGILMPVIGLFGIIVIDIATFLVGVTTLWITRVPQPRRRPEVDTGKALRGLQKSLFGLKYIVQRRGLFAMLVYFALVNFAANLSSVILPPLVLTISDSTSLGLVQMSAGLGMLIGSVVVSVWGGPKRKMPMVYGAIALSGLGLSFVGLIPSVPTIAIGVFVMLTPLPLVNGPVVAIWQTKVEPDVQGQVFAARGMIAAAMMPIAYGIAGPLADRFFEPLMSGPQAPALLSAMLGTGPGRGYGTMMVISGLLLLVATVVFALYRPLRRVEEDLPDVEVVEESENSEALPGSASHPEGARGNPVPAEDYPPSPSPTLQ